MADERIDVAWVPGAFEIPTVAGELAASGRYAAVICLGAVIRGETSHDQHINRAVSNALAEIGVHYGLPVLFGMLTCNTLEQAIARSGGDAATTGKDQGQKRIGNKGVDCAEAALEMVDLLAQLRRRTAIVLHSSAFIPSFNSSLNQKCLVAVEHDRSPFRSCIRTI